MIFINKEHINKSIEHLWIVRDILDNDPAMANITEEQELLILGRLKKAESLIYDICYELLESDNKNESD